MQLNANAFAKCAPAISNTLRHCGSVGLCDVIPLTSSDLDAGGVYLDGDGAARVLDHLLLADFEIKQCEANQDGWYEFLMSQRVNMSHKVVPMGIHQQTQRIAPFILADQLSPINDTYWLFNSGAVIDGDNPDGPWSYNVVSPTNIPVSVNRFPVGRRVFLFGQSAAGSATQTAWRVTSVEDTSGVGAANQRLEVTLAPMNSESNLDADRLEPPTEGWLRVGTNNVDDYEIECNEMPSYLNNKEVPFWIQTVRWSWCDSTRYAEYRELLMKGNALWRKFFDLPETKRNKQLMLTQQRDFVHQFFYAKPLANQSMATYNQLENITSFDGDDLGIDGGVCVGKRAEAVGVIEQLAECGRVIDLLGLEVNLPALFMAFYHILRIRESNGDRNKIVDVFTDSFTADLLNQAMWKYYSSKITDHNGDAILRANKSIDTQSTKAQFGFSYKSYQLDFPSGATMNVITHYAFDDELDVANQAGIQTTARKLWILDFKGIYPGIIASNSLRHDTGALKQLAALRSDFQCVMKVHTKMQSLFSQTYTVVVECPSGNLILENFSGFDHAQDPSISYDSATTSTTTTPA